MGHTSPQAKGFLFGILVMLLLGIAGNMGFKDEQKQAALGCEMVKAGKWPASYCEHKR